MDPAWPFATKCRNLGTTGIPCVNSFDCTSSQYCWYANLVNAQSDSKTCMPLYSKPYGTLFGWVYIDSADGMTNALVNGQYCQSGFAIYVGSYTAQCSMITQVSSDFGVVPAPYACSVANPMNTCRYYYNNLEYIT